MFTFAFRPTDKDIISGIFIAISIKSYPKMGIELLKKEL